MYEIIQAVIHTGKYELSEMLRKIDTIWLQGNITDCQRTELIDLAREKADPSNSYASLQQQITGLYRNYTELAAKMKSIAEEIIVLQGGTVETPPKEEYPEYVQPTGAHDAYQTGDKVTYNGQHYICQTDGCVWNPDVYPAGWEIVE